MSAAPLYEVAWPHAPVTVATNLVIAAQCLFLGIRLRREARRDTSADWARFFLLLSLATLTGAVKHGAARDAHPGVWFAAVILSNTAGAAAIAFAQLATVAALVRNVAARVWLRRAIVLQVSFTLVATILRPGFLPALVDTVIGLAPVLVVQTLAAMQGRAGAGSIASGLVFMTLSAGVYVLGLAVPPWLDHVDLAHVVAIAGLALIGHGARRQPRVTAWRVLRTDRPERSVRSWPST